MSRALVPKWVHDNLDSYELPAYYPFTVYCSDDGLLVKYLHGLAGRLFNIMQVRHV